MRPTRARRSVPDPARPFEREEEFQAAVLELARGLGWGVSYSTWKSLVAEAAEYQAAPPELDGLAFHPRWSMGSDPGWPDLVLVRRRDRRLIFAELKLDAGKLTPRQAAVIDLLQALEVDGPLVRIEVHVWRPRDLDAIAEVLR